MKFTNKTGIRSQALVDALCDDDYDLTKRPDNVWSCTEIIGSPKIAVLKRRHWDDLVVDASDRLWSMMGSAMHSVVEHKIATKSRERLSEERWVLRVPIRGGDWNCWFLDKGQKIEDQSWYKKDDYYVSGRMDTYDAEEKSLEDYKFTSAWTFVYNSREEEWTAQLNMNRFAVELAGFQVEKLRIGGLLRDFDKKKVGSDNYPSGSIVEKSIRILPDDEIKAYILDRVSLHSLMLERSDYAIPECTEEERWYRAGKYALMKKGKKRAEKLFPETPDGKVEAEHMCRQMNDVSEKGSPFYIEPRPGEDKRCHDYCDCNTFCNYYQDRYGESAMTADKAW